MEIINTDWNDENISLSDDGHILLLNGEVCCLRFLHCTECDLMVNQPLYINLAYSEEMMKKAKYMFGEFCPQCGCTEFKFITYEELMGSIDTNEEEL